MYTIKYKFNEISITEIGLGQKIWVMFILYLLNHRPV